MLRTCIRQEGCWQVLAFECGFAAVVDRAIQLRRVLLCDAAKEAKRRAEAVDES
jgi:hypothetical protein